MAKKQAVEMQINEVIPLLQDAYRKRNDFLRAEGNAVRQMKAVCRRWCNHDKTEGTKLYKQIMELTKKGKTTKDKNVLTAYEYLSTFVSSYKEMHARKLFYEGQVKSYAESLPVWEYWGESIKGFGLVSLGLIIGETGNLSNYDNPAKVWKRMGLAVVGGERQRKHKDKAKALEHGYSPTRRSVMFVIGESLIKSQNEYRELYLERKVFEKEKAESKGLTVKPSADIPKSDKDNYMSEGHVHNRSKRYMEKRLLKQLWIAWRGSCDEGDPIIVKLAA